MTGNGWFQIFLYFVALLLVTKPVGVFLYRVFERKGTFLDFVLRPLERLIYRLCAVDEEKEMRWTEYGAAMLWFSTASLVLLYLFERLQLWLPWNPQKLTNVAPDLAWNTAVSFTTNTNWQSYSGESTMSYLTQMAGLAYHNFASAAVALLWPSPWSAVSPAANPRPSAISGSISPAPSSGCSCLSASLRRSSLSLKE